MSWTSEFELPPQGPQILPDDELRAEESEPAAEDAGTDFSDDRTELDDEDSELNDEDSELGVEDAEPVDEDTDLIVEDAEPGEPEAEPDGPGFLVAAIPDDGPLDPSVFDGLFTDLTASEVEPIDQLDDSKNDDLDAPAANETGRGAIVFDAFDELLDGVIVSESPEFDDEELPAAGDFAWADEFEVEPEPEAEAEPEPETEAEPGAEIEADVEEEAEVGVEPEVEVEVEADETELLLLDEIDAEYDSDFGDADEPEAALLSEEEETEVEELGVPEDDADPSGDDLLAEDGADLEDNPVLEEPALYEESLVLEEVQDLPQVIEQPQPALATSPPIALDEHHPDEHVPLAEAQYQMPAAAVVDQFHPSAQPVRRRRWPSFVTAIVIGGTLGIGGAFLLTRMQEDGDQTAGSAQGPLVANEVTNQPATDSATTTDQSDADGAATEQADQGSLLADGRLVVHAVDFVPGTAELTPSAQNTLQQVADSVVGLPPEPTAITVRTFTETNAEANRQLSAQQAAAIGEYLASLGVEFGGLTVRGIGAAPLEPSMPVDNFVVARSTLRTSGLKDAVSSIGPFEIGVDPDSLQLRPESINALVKVGDALTANAEGSISLAGYSYDRPTGEANELLATAAVEAAREYLINTHGVDPARLLLLAPGPLPYVLGPEQGGHVEIKRGRSVAVDVAVHSVEQPVITFAAGSDALSGAAAEELSRVATLLAEAQTTAVISVRSSGEATADANRRLSELQASAIASYLSETGLAEGQVRVYGVGDVKRLRSETAPNEVTITLLP